jgi:L-2-hydroxyglutarate oxidase LhgO
MSLEVLVDRHNGLILDEQVIGGGAVGLAIARQLAARDGTSTILIERNGGVGMETSSRNSEVFYIQPLL